MIEVVGKKLVVKGPQELVDSLRKNAFGTAAKGAIALAPEEALYLMDVRGVACVKNGRALSFNQLASQWAHGRRFFARYYALRDWRNHGLILRPISEARRYSKSPLIEYPSREAERPRIKARGLWCSDDLMSIIDDEAEGLALYENYWFGQWGTYKTRAHGRCLKLDAYETLFLSRNAGYRCNVSTRVIEKQACARRRDFEALYNVYADWRLRGYVLKTGFKFGTHFRLYFPGALPTKTREEWIHSRHALHVFPRRERLLISEWARAVRVAHSVRKTFLLAIPGKRARPRALDYLAYWRREGLVEHPCTDEPSFAMLALSEEERIGGSELAGAIASAAKIGLDLLLAIVDRETSVTYYRIKRVQLPGSRYEYYEIEWMQP